MQLNQRMLSSQVKKTDLLHTEIVGLGVYQQEFVEPLIAINTGSFFFKHFFSIRFASLRKSAIVVGVHIGELLLYWLSNLFLLIHQSCVQVNKMAKKSLKYAQQVIGYWSARAILVQNTRLSIFAET